MPYVELLAKSCFSFLTGASHPEELVSRAAELQMPALGLCDRDGLYGAVRAHNQAKESGVKLIVGAELTLASSDVVRAPELSELRMAARADKLAYELAPRLILLAQNHSGYMNLCRLLTASHAGLPKGLSWLALDDLALHHQGLLAVVTPPRRLGKAWREDEIAEGFSGFPASLLEGVFEIFTRHDFHLGAYRRLDGFDSQRLSFIEHWSTRLGAKVFASAYPLYHVPERKDLSDVLCSMRFNLTLDRAGTLLEPNDIACVQSEPMMRKLFAEHSEWIDETSEIAERCDFSFEQISYEFPCTIDSGETADSMLAKLTWQGLGRRYPEGFSEAVRQQVERELALIAQLKMAPYFLSTWEVVEIARRRRILCQGRGSAANSAVCFALGITAVDPARSNLLFERFMSVERHEPPDIDIDFEHERREEVIQEIYERHGRDRAAMVSEVIRFRGKSAVREVGKVLGLPEQQLNRLTGTISYWGNLEELESQAAGLGLDMGSQRLTRVLDLARQLQGFPRHLSIHVGGFVLSAAPLYTVAPVEPARMLGRSVIPWDKDDIESLGFFKVDVLALGMLSAIRKTLELLHHDGFWEARGAAGETFDPIETLARIPPGDPAVYSLASRADTVGIFQIESRAQMAMLPRLRPKCFYDLVIEVAIVRPGPIQGGMVHPYLRRRNGEEPVRFPHEALKPILERTLGVPLFQEQVMQISIVGAGYSGGEADQLRRDMAAWKKTGRLLRHRERLLDGFTRRGIAREFGEALFEQIKGFGEYGFPESHAASFALLVYASAWQKAHFPAHFVCSLLNSQPMGFYSPRSLIRDAQKRGVAVREVDVLLSQWDCTLEDGQGSHIQSSYRNAQRSLRLGLRLVKGLGQASAERLLMAREQCTFESLEDMVRRSRLKKDEVEALAESGALERLIAGRRQALWLAAGPRGFGLFEHVDGARPSAELPALKASEQLLLDYERLGFSLSDHPMRHLRPQLNRQRVLRAVELSQALPGSEVWVAGLVQSRQRPSTASGVVFITLEDETGVVNVIVFSRVFEKYRLPAVHASFLMIRGKVELQQNAPLEFDIDSEVNAGPQCLAERPQRIEVPPIIHVLAEELTRLELPGQQLRAKSRDFH